MLVVQGLIEYICSQLPEFFGGLCTCSNQGGCLRSNKGPWSDPLIMKVVFLLNLLVLSYCIILMVHSMESSALRDIVQVSDIEETITGSVRLRALKARLRNIRSVSSHLFNESISFQF